MKNGWVPQIEVYEEKLTGLWHWKIFDPMVGKVIATAAEGAVNREDCLIYLKMMGRMVTAWAVAEELSLGSQSLAISE